MPTSTSRFAYQDCYDLMNQALADGKGIRVKNADYGAARNLQGRIHSARSVDRKGNEEVYEFDHPMHGRSQYDKLFTTIIRENAHVWVQIEVTDTKNYTIESLSKGTDQCELKSTDEPSTSPTATSEDTSVQRLRRLP